MSNYFAFSRDNVNWINDLPVPSSLSVNGEDFDLDSGRSCVNGNITRRIIGYKWSAISFSWNFLTEAQASYLINTIRTANNVYIKTKSPLLSVNGIVTLCGYVSRYSADLVKSAQGDGYSVSFNFVEGKR